MSDTALRPVRPQMRFVTLRTISAMVLRQMSTTYGRSPGGYLWAILEPAAGIILLTAIFSAGFRNPSLGTNFAIYYASGFMPFIMFLKVSSSLGSSVRASRNLLTFPRVTVVDAIVAVVILEVLTQLLISYIILSAILAIYDTRTVLKMEYLIQAYLMAIALGIGIGLLNCFLSLAFNIWRSIWSIMTRPLVLISGVIFLHERVPMPYREWFEWNPLVHVVGLARRSFYISYHAEYVDQVFCYMVAGICGVIGAVFLRKYYRDLLER